LPGQKDWSDFVKGANYFSGGASPPMAGYGSANGKRKKKRLFILTQ